MSERIENAEIQSTMLGIEDHGIFTAFVNVGGEGWGCGFGGYALDAWVEGRGRRMGVGEGIEFIRRVCEVVGVEKWESLKGKHCRVEFDRGGFAGSRIVAIGHITKNKWFRPVEELWWR